MFTRLIGILLLTTLLMPASAEVELNPQRPERYVVVSGDTLWDIAGKFITYPWLWTELWHANPQIENPNFIYPGDIITLRIVNGQPLPEITRGGAVTKISPVGVVKLWPTIRKSPLVEPVPTIPLDAIQSFLSQTRVSSVDELEHAAYVIGQTDHRLASVTGDSIYVRGLTSSTVTHYGVYRAGRTYERPLNDKPPVLLGMEATFIGEVELQHAGDPATLLVTRSVTEMLAGDRLLPNALASFNSNFMPHLPSTPIEGHIIQVLGGVSNVTRLQSVVIDRGKEDGLEVGHVLVIDHAGGTVDDPFAHKTTVLPPEVAGTLMIFRVFDRVSYALVLEERKAMSVLDVVHTPKP